MSKQTKKQNKKVAKKMGPNRVSEKKIAQKKEKQPKQKLDAAKVIYPEEPEIELGNNAEPIVEHNEDDARLVDKNVPPFDTNAFIANFLKTHGV
jgi:hypothetical protein